jgi:CBS domain-containing membrane protein
MRLFKPILAGGSLPDRLLACLGATIGIGLTMLICGRLHLGAADLPIIVAPLGASAVLAFAVPASPLAQPWSVIGGNTVSAVVGVAAWRLIPDVTVAAAVAVGGAILVMSLLRCLHPPGGAAALTAVIGGPAVHAAGFAFALAPVALNSLALAMLAIVFHRAGRHSYPHVPVALPPLPGRLHVQPADIDAALEDMHESFDIAREDLDALLDHAARHAAERQAGS